MSRTRRYIGIGRETVASPETTAVRVYPFIGDTDECCEECGAVAPREEMAYAGSDPDGVALYVCAGCVA